MKNAFFYLKLKNINLLLVIDGLIKISLSVDLVGQVDFIVSYNDIHISNFFYNDDIFA